MRILLPLLFLFTFLFTNSFGQETRCSFVEKTIGYLYDPATKEYKEKIRTYQRDKVCIGAHTIAIGRSTSYYMGTMISEKKEGNSTIYRMYAKDHNDNELILQISFTPKMVISAFYDDEFYINYFVEDDN